MEQQKTALAAVFTGAGKALDVRSFPITAPKGKDVLLRLIASGICGTDIHIVTGRLAVPPDFIPGHEFIGQVQRLGSSARSDGLGKRLSVGDTAIACVAKACGKCFNCKRDELASCLQFGVTYVRSPATAPHFFGGYGEALYQSAEQLVKVPAGVDVNAVAAFPCAGPTVIRALQYGGPLKKGELVVVQGTGPMGLFAIAWAAKAGCRVIAIGSRSNPKRMELAKAMGADLVLDRNETSVAQRLSEVKAIATKMKRGDGADVVIEASGSPMAFIEGIGLARTRGTYLTPGQYSASGAVELHPEVLTFKALRVIGSGQYTMADIGAYLRFLQKNRDLQPIFASCVTHRYHVKDANLALADAIKGNIIKGIFTC